MMQKTMWWKVCTVPLLCSGHQVLLPRDNQVLHSSLPPSWIFHTYKSMVAMNPCTAQTHHPYCVWGGGRSATHSLEMLCLRVNPPHCSLSMMQPAGLWPDTHSSSLVFAPQLWPSQSCTSFLPPLPSQASDPCPGIWKLFPPHACFFSPLSSSMVSPNKPLALVIPFWFLLPGGPKLTETHPLLSQVMSMYTGTSLAVWRLRLHGRGKDPCRSLPLNTVSFIPFTTTSNCLYVYCSSPPDFKCRSVWLMLLRTHWKNVWINN